MVLRIRKFFQVILIICSFFSTIVYAQDYIGGWRVQGGSCGFWGLTKLEACKALGFDNVNYYGKCSYGSADGGVVITGCAMEFVAVLFSGTPRPQVCSGNPIDTSSGVKIQHEIDIPPKITGGVEFGRVYSYANINNTWYRSYQQTAKIINPHSVNSVREKSSPVSTRRSSACTLGWSEIKSRINDSSMQNVTANYKDGICWLQKDGVFIDQLGIVSKEIDGNAKVPGIVWLIREDGSTFGYEYSLNKNVLGMNGARQPLVFDSTAQTWLYHVSSDRIEEYALSGKLVSISNKNGVKQQMFYDSVTGLLSSVKDSTGRELIFTYAGNQLTSVTVDGNKTTSYTYNGHGVITRVTRPDNTFRIYHYEDSRFVTALTGITDERGIRYATWTYDAQGRAISSEHAGGADKTQLAFNSDGSTTVTNPLGKKTIYRFRTLAGARRVVKVEGQPTANCIGANQDYAYTREGWLKSKTDWKGITTTFEYNTKGQEISRTEAFGTTEAKIITSEWHPTLYVKTKETEPDRETLYSYDTNGNLLSRTVNSLTAP